MTPVAEPGRSNHGRYHAADERTRDEVGGVLERAFRREGGDEPREEEKRRLFAWAEEAETKAEAAERMANEAEGAAAAASERFGIAGQPDDLELAARWRSEAESHRREAERLREEAERLRHYG